MAQSNWKNSEVRPSEHKNYEDALSDARRRIHDEELAALANLALIRSTFEQRKQNEKAVRGESLEQRLENLMGDAFPDHRPGNR